MAIVLGAGDVEVDLPRLAGELMAALRAAPAGPAEAGTACTDLEGAGTVGADPADPAEVGTAGADPTRPANAAPIGADPASASPGPAGAGAAGAPQRVRVPVTPDVTAMILLPGLAPGIPAYTVKVHAKNPNRSPAITGVICLHDLKTGDLLALIDSAPLTALRTGLGGALGAHLLARPDARHVTVIGAGAQGRAQLEALAALRPIESVLVRDTDPAAEERFVAWAGGLGIKASAASAAGSSAGTAIRATTASAAPPLTTPDDATPRTTRGTTALRSASGTASRLTSAATTPGATSTATIPSTASTANAATPDPASLGEIVLMATWSREPVLHHVAPGTHITSLGADEPGKVELAQGILDEALVVVDDAALAHVAADTTIGGVLRGEHAGRTRADQVTVYSPVGLPMQDLVIAWHVYRNACRKSPAVFDIGGSDAPPREAGR